jgi:hypothetical protein
VKNGYKPKKIIAGKKYIGIANPGNISGNSISNGKLILNGPRILKKLRTVIKTFNQPFRLGFLKYSNNP